jgi:hypothetical protein
VCTSTHIILVCRYAVLTRNSSNDVWLELRAIGTKIIRQTLFFTAAEVQEILTHSRKMFLEIGEQNLAAKLLPIASLPKLKRQLTGLVGIPSLQSPSKKICDASRISKSSADESLLVANNSVDFDDIFGAAHTA